MNSGNELIALSLLDYIILRLKQERGSLFLRTIDYLEYVLSREILSEAFQGRDFSFSRYLSNTYLAISILCQY